MVGSKTKYPSYNIVIDGDSIDLGAGVGVGSSADFTTQMKISLTRIVYNVTNVAVSGQCLGTGVTPNMISRSNPTSKFDSSYTANILLMGGGTNDICRLLTDGWAVSHIFTDWQTYYNARIAEGWVIIPRTVLPRSQPACGNVVNFNPDRNSYNTLMRNYCTANNITVCDCGADATIGVDGASDNFTYYQSGDQVHLIQAGANILGSLYGASIMSKISKIPI